MSVHSEIEKPVGNAAASDVLSEMRRRKDMLVTAIQSTALCNSTERMEAQVEILEEFIDLLDKNEQKDQEREAV